jgi:hypothetical protein
MNTQVALVLLEGKVFGQPALYNRRRGLNMDKKCPVCGKVYMTFDKKKKYCSDACAKKANKAK